MPPHENLRKVRPRVWSTDLTQIPIAADSLLEPGLGFTKVRTFLIHRQKSPNRPPGFGRVFVESISTPP